MFTFLFTIILNLLESVRKADKQLRLWIPNTREFCS